MWEGVERADSLVLNPHKWLGAGFDLSAYYVRDPQHLMRVMSTDPSYLRTAQDGAVRNLRDWGIPLGRRFRALKLWFVIREHGVEGLQRRVRRDLENAALAGGAGRRGTGLAAAGPGAAADGVRSVTRRRTWRATRRPWTVHNLALAEAVNASGRFYLTTALVKGRRSCASRSGAQATEREHVEGVWRALQEAASKVEEPRDPKVCAAPVRAFHPSASLSVRRTFSTGGERIL